MTRAIINYTVALALSFVLASAGRAEITWLPESSTYNGTLFAALPIPMPGFGRTTTGTPAYGAGVNSSGNYVLGFVNAIPSSPGLPSFPATELSATPLIAGTSLVLVFQKAPTDNINFAALLADAAQTISYELLSSTQFRIRCTMVDPVNSASGDAGAAFGLLVNYAATAGLNFKGTVFATDMHFLDIGAPSDLNTGTAGLKASGVNGTAANFYAYLPLQFLSTIGITEATSSSVNGYMDGVPVVPGTFQNLGLDSSLGYDFQDSSNPNNTVLKVKVTNSVWSAHTIGFGRIDKTGPVLVLTGKATRKVTSATTQVKGTVTDDSGVTKVQYSLKSASSGYSTATLKGAAWSVKLKNLKKKKTQKVYVRATDTLGNVSAVTLIKVTRTK